jgi:carbamoylphosphate synthase small subunit
MLYHRNDWPSGNLTGPSYFGQLPLTNAHGNYGVNENEVESDGIKISGLVSKNFSFNCIPELILSESLESTSFLKSYLYFRC